MRRILFSGFIFVSGIIIGGIAVGALVGRAQFECHDRWYGVAVLECAQRVGYGGYVHLNEMQRASQSIDQAIANQMAGLLLGPVSGRDITDQEAFALRFIRTYMELHPDRFEEILADDSKLEAFPPLSIEEMEERCEKSGVCDGEMLTMMLRLHALAAPLGEER